MKPSILTTISRYLKQRELNRTRECLAELDALIVYWSDKVDLTTGGIPPQVANNMGEWRGKRAKLVVRRDRLEKELRLVKAGD